MTVPLWVWELARAFWRAAGPEPEFPRDLQAALSRSPLLVTVEEMPRLTLRRVRDYLAQRGVEVSAPGDRRLRGFLIAPAGHGWIFLDADDPAEERRFSLAHELAHYLRHEWQPRQRARAVLGEGSLEVLDGRRAASTAERAAAVLRGVRLAPFTHLMAREGSFVPEDVRRAEEEADELAIELLAPEDEILARCPGDRHAAARLLETFGLPEGIALTHARRLFPAPEPAILSERLKNARNRCRTPNAGGEPDGRR